MHRLNPDPTAEAILRKAEAELNEAKQRCQEATGHLRNREHVAAIGALAGLDDRVRNVSTMLTVLRDAQAAVDQPSIDFNQNGGEVT